MTKDPTQTPQGQHAKEQSKAAGKDNKRAPINVDAGDGEITITSDSGDTLTLYSEHVLTATYTGSDERVKTIGWTAQQVAPPGQADWSAPSQILVVFDPPRSELINGQAKTNILVYGAFTQAGDEAKGIDVYARVLEMDVDVQRGMKNFSCNVPAVPPGNILALDSVEGDPVTTGDAFHMFVATCSTYDGKSPIWPPQWYPLVDWSAEIVSPNPPPDAQIQLMSFSMTDDSTTLYNIPPSTGSGPSYALNGIRVTSSEPVLVEVTALITEPDHYSRKIRVQFQKDASLSSQGVMELYPLDPEPWLADGNTHTVQLSYDRPGGVPEGTSVFWWPFLIDILGVQNAYTFTNSDQSTSNSVSQWRSPPYFGYWDFTGITIARSLNSQTGAYDYGKLPVFYKYSDQDAIVVTPDPQERTGQKLYAPRTLNATYRGDKTFSQVTWSVDLEENPEYMITFEPNPSTVTSESGTLTTTTQMTVNGPNKPVNVTAYAESADGDFVVGRSYLLTFHPVEQAPQGNEIVIVSLDGDTLKERDDTGPQWHMLKAIYRQLDGTPIAGASLTWRASDNSITIAQPTGGKTNSDGVMTNVIQTTRTDQFDFTVTVSADNTSDTLTIPLTFQPTVDALPGQQLVTITLSGGADKLEFDKPYPVVANFQTSSLPQLVTWTAFPADRLTFTQGVTQILDGAMTNYVKASPGPDIPVALISATSFHSPSTYITVSSPVGIYDHSEPDLVLSFEGGISDTIVIKADSPPLYLFNTDQLIDGTYTGDKQFNEVVWSVDPEENPDYAITFDPNPSPATAEDGGRTTQTKMTVYGKNQPTTVTVYAYSADYVRSVGQDFVKGVQSLDFLPASKPPQTGWIELVSLEGNPLAEGSGAPLIQATYRLGNMGGFEPLTWEIVDDSSGGTVSLLTLHGETDVNGVMINSVTTTSTGPVTFTVKVTSDDYGDVGTLDLAFQPKEDVPQLPGQEIMTIHSPDGTTLTIGDTHPLSVDYSGSEVTWIGFPSDRLVFGQTESKTTTVQVLDGPDIPDAAVMTVHFNKDIGAYDYGYLALSFKTKQTQGVVGVTIDKAYALNTDTFVDPTVQSQVIACQLQLQADNNQNQQILLPTDPGTIVASFVNAQGNDLPKKTDGTYYINTGNDGKATFFVGSENPSTFILNTQWQNKDQPASATLTVATNAPPGTWPAPVVPDLGGGTTLQIPSGCPAPTFQVTIPNGAPAGNMALLLNSRIVYRGLVDPAKNPVVEVAYCALDLSGTNVLVYLPESSVNLSLPCSFTVDTTNGNPQTGPCPNLERKLFAPDGLDASQTIGAGDILPPGLSVYIEPYENMEAGDDVITAFFYLQGTDVLSQETGGVALSINNIVVSEPYPVTNDSFKDGSIPMTLPQWAAAGYANGQLQVDYMVVGKKNGTRWSEISPTVPLNTTIPFPAA